MKAIEDFSTDYDIHSSIRLYQPDPYWTVVGLDWRMDQDYLYT